MVADVRSAILEVFSSIKNEMIDLFNVWYADVSEIATASTAVVVLGGVQGRGSFQYRDFNNTNPLELNGIKDPVVAIQWISDVAGFFFTCSYPENWKVRCTLNLLHMGVQDWWNIVMVSYDLEYRVAITWG